MGKKVEAFELWCYRRMQRIKWVEKISNKEVLRRMEMEETVLVKIVVNNKEKYLRERMRNNELFATAINGKILGKATRGRKRMSLLNDKCIRTFKIILIVSNF